MTFDTSGTKAASAVTATGHLTSLQKLERFLFVDLSLSSRSFPIRFRVVSARSVCVCFRKRFSSSVSEETDKKEGSLIISFMILNLYIRSPRSKSAFRLYAEVKLIVERNRKISFFFHLVHVLLQIKNFSYSSRACEDIVNPHMTDSDEIRSFEKFLHLLSKESTTAQRPI